MRIVRFAAALSVAALAVACSNASPSSSAASSSSPSPTSPTSSTPLTANSDGSTLKVSAPTPTAPANNATLAQAVVSTQLQATAATGQFTTAALTHRFEVYQGTAAAGTPVATLYATPNGAAVSVATPTLDFLTTYAWRVRAESSSGYGPWSSTQTFKTGGQPRRDANAYGGQIPRSVAVGDLQSQLGAVAGAHAPELLASCNNGRNAIDFPTVLLKALRQIDNRWGFNCRRGNCSDPSNDVVVYHWSPGSSEQSTNVYVYDVIGGRDAQFGCNAQIVDVTDPTYQSGSTGRYSLLGIFPPNNPDY